MSWIQSGRSNAMIWFIDQMGVKIYSSYWRKIVLSQYILLTIYSWMHATYDFSLDLYGKPIYWVTVYEYLGNIMNPLCQMKGKMCRTYAEYSSNKAKQSGTIHLNKLKNGGMFQPGVCYICAKRWNSPSCCMAAMFGVHRHVDTTGQSVLLVAQDYTFSEIKC